MKLIILSFHIPRGSSISTTSTFCISIIGPHSTSMRDAVEDRLGQWSDDIGGLLKRIGRDRYLLLFEEQYMEKIIAEKFSVLEQVRGVVSPSGIHATLSVGIGRSGAGFAEDMCLLHYLWTNSETLGVEVFAAHFDHQLRGLESARDRTFVKDWCAARGIPCEIGFGRVREYAEKNGMPAASRWATTWI